MAGSYKYDWPEDRELVEQIVAAGGRQQWSDSTGIPERTLQSHCRKRGLSGEITTKLRQAVKAQRDVVGSREDRRAEEERAELKHLRREVQRLTKAIVGQEALFDRIVEETRLPVKRPRVRVKKQAQKKPVRAAVLPIYDQQYGQFVRATDVPGGKGGYSAKVFDERLARWLDGVTGNLSLYADSYNVEELAIVLGGDQVEGDEIFAGQSWQLEFGPPQQVWQLACKMEDALRTVIRFAREEIGVRHLSLLGVTGNHGKVGGKKSGARPSDYNWDWLMLKILFDKLRKEPADECVIEPGGALFFRCGGHEFQAIHGDEIRGWGGLPFYGLTRFDGRSIRLHNTIYRYLLMGHHHQPATIPNGAGETIVSGDWVGGNNMSRFLQATSRPQQSVIFVAPKWGITEQARIYFEEADVAYRAPAVHGRAA